MPKYDSKFNHAKDGKNVMYMSFFNKMKRDFKSKRVIGDDKKWCTSCKSHGHLVSEWRCPNIHVRHHKDEITEEDVELSPEDYDWTLPADVAKYNFDKVKKQRNKELVESRFATSPYSDCRVYREMIDFALA